MGPTFGADGSLPVASRNSNAILRHDGTTGAFQSTVVDTAASGRTAPEAVLFGPDGHLHVTGFRATAGYRYDGATGAFLGRSAAAD